MHPSRVLEVILEGLAVLLSSAVSSSLCVMASLIPPLCFGTLLGHMKHNFIELYECFPLVVNGDNVKLMIVQTFKPLTTLLTKVHSARDLWITALHLALTLLYAAHKVMLHILKIYIHYT